MPTVSVIIPCYNHAHYLPDAVHSVLAQTFTDWEAIIVDDGSTDNTRDVAAQFTDPRVRYIHQENRGLSVARNTGIRVAEGDMLVMLDADDFWHPDFLRKMVSLLLSSENAAAVYCGTCFVNESGQIVGSPKTRTVAPEKFYETLICEGNWLVVHSVLFKKQLAEEVGLFDETLPAVEDADLWTRLSSKHEFVGYPEALVYYRRHGDNMSNDPSRMVSASYEKTVKAFGLPEGSLDLWPPLKRCAFARVFQLGLRLHLAKGDFQESVRFFAEFGRLSPLVIQSTAFWENLALVYLPLEYRGDSRRIKLSESERHILGLLQNMSDESLDSFGLGGLYPRIRATAFLGLARISVRSRSPRSCLKWLCGAFLSYRRIFFSKEFWVTVKRLIGLGWIDPSGGGLQ